MLHPLPAAERNQRLLIVYDVPHIRGLMVHVRMSWDWACRLQQHLQLLVLLLLLRTSSSDEQFVITRLSRSELKHSLFTRDFLGLWNILDRPGSASLRSLHSSPRGREHRCATIAALVAGGSRGSHPVRKERILIDSPSIVASAYNCCQVSV